MRAVVTDSSPLIILARSGLLAVLRDVTGEVLVPAAVLSECTDDPGRPGAQAILRAQQDGLIRLRSEVEVSWTGGPPPMLDAGELAALALAREIGCPVLMDERLGRQVARLHRIPVLGSAGILLAAKARGLLPEIAPVLTAWRAWGYFLSPELLKAVLLRAGEGE